MSPVSPADIFSLPALEAGSPRSMSQQVGFLPSLLSLACRWRLLSVLTWPLLCALPVSLLIVTPVPLDQSSILITPLTLNIALAKEFLWIFLYTIMEKHQQTYWPTQYLLKELMSKCSHLLRSWGLGLPHRHLGSETQLSPCHRLIRCHGSNSAGSKEAMEIQVQQMLQRERIRASRFSPLLPHLSLTPLCPCPHLHPIPSRPCSQCQSVTNSLCHIPTSPSSQGFQCT